MVKKFEKLTIILILIGMFVNVGISAKADGSNVKTDETQTLTANITWEEVPTDVPIPDVILQLRIRNSSGGYDNYGDKIVLQDGTTSHVFTFPKGSTTNLRIVNLSEIQKNYTYTPGGYNIKFTYKPQVAETQEVLANVIWKNVPDGITVPNLELQLKYYNKEEEKYNNFEGVVNLTPGETGHKYTVPKGLTYNLTLVNSGAYSTDYDIKIIGYTITLTYKGQQPYILTTDVTWVGVPEDEIIPSIALQLTKMNKDTGIYDDYGEAVTLAPNTIVHEFEVPKGPSYNLRLANYSEYSDQYTFGIIPEGDGFKVTLTYKEEETYDLTANIVWLGVPKNVTKPSIDLQLVKKAIGDVEYLNFEGVVTLQPGTIDHSYTVPKGATYDLRLVNYDDFKNNYTFKITYVEGGFKVTLTYLNKIDLIGEVEWIGGPKPSTTSIQLYKDGNPLISGNIMATGIIETETGWKGEYSFIGLEELDGNEQPYVYTIDSGENLPYY